MFTKLQTSVNMNLSQLSKNLQWAEMVIQFCKEKNLIDKIMSSQACEHPCHLKKWGKIMPGDAVTPNPGPALLLNCQVEVQNSYKTPPTSQW